MRYFIYASNEPKSVPARDLGDCRDNYEKLAKRVSCSLITCIVPYHERSSNIIIDNIYHIKIQQMKYLKQ